MTINHESVKRNACLLERKQLILAHCNTPCHPDFQPIRQECVSSQAIIPIKNGLKNVNKSSQWSVNSFAMEKSSLSNWAPLLPQGDAPELSGEHLIQPFDHDDQNWHPFCGCRNILRNPRNHQVCQSQINPTKKWELHGGKFPGLIRHIYILNGGSTRWCPRSIAFSWCK